MANLLKIIGRIMGISLEWVLIFVIFLAFAIRSTQFQTFLAQKAGEFLSSELKTTVKVDEVAILFFDKVAFDGLLVLDQKKDTLLFVESFYITIDDFSIKDNWYKVKNAELENGLIQINRDKHKGVFNFAFLMDYFKPKKKSKKKTAIELSLNQIDVKKVRFLFDDYRYQRTAYGLDYNHLNFNEFSINLSRFKFDKKGAVSLEIGSLKAKEQCGLYIQKLSSRLLYSTKGIEFTDLHIQTVGSDLKSPHFKLLTPTPTAFSHFVDSVSFNARFEQSRISLRDVSLFVPAMKGMDEVLQLSVTISKPIKNMQLNDVDLRFGRRSFVRGNFHLPNFNRLDEAAFKQVLTSAYIDLSDVKRIRLPESSKSPFITLDPIVEKLQYIALKKTQVLGKINRLKIVLNELKTEMGIVRLKNGIALQGLAGKAGVRVAPIVPERVMLELESIDLGGILNNNQFGLVQAKLNFDGYFPRNKGVELTNIRGEIPSINAMGYLYENIFIDQLDFLNNSLEGGLRIKDKNIQLSFDGKLDFNKELMVNADLDIQHVDLSHLGVVPSDSTILQSKIRLDTKGTSPNLLEGRVVMNDLRYTSGQQILHFDTLGIYAKRGQQDSIQITSDYASLKCIGKIDFFQLPSDITSEFNKIFPSYVEQGGMVQGVQAALSTNNFKITMDLTNPEPVLAIFAPEIHIAKQSEFKLELNKGKGTFVLDYDGDYIHYDNLKFQGIKLDQNHDQDSVMAQLKVNALTIGDSIQLDNLQFNARGFQNKLNSILTWNQQNKNPSKVNWQTDLTKKEEIGIDINTSFFSVNGQRWDIKRPSKLQIKEGQVNFRNNDSLFIERNNQMIVFSGEFGKNADEKLRMNLSQIDLSDLSDFLGLKVHLKGKLSGMTNLSTPFDDLVFGGALQIKQLYVDERLIGNIDVSTNYKSSEKKIGTNGVLWYPDTVRTFSFSGAYNLDSEEEALDYRLKFSKTDLSFVNAFLDPAIASNVQGSVSGSLKLKGSISQPEITCDTMKLNDVSAHSAMLGVKFTLDGRMVIKKDGMFFKEVSIYDEERNKGKVFGFVKHNNFEKWKYNVQLDFHDSKKQKGEQTSDYRFLAMNTSYKEGDMYYGKAYVQGMVNVSGNQDQTKLLLDLETKNGTLINFPMYGVTEVAEDQGFIVFKKEGVDVTSIPVKSKLTGLNLDMNFRMTPEAQVKVIFNELTGDELTANGEGDILMKMDDLGDMTMNGTYRIKNGIYNFAMGVLKQPFFIEEGGTISWTGDPIKAQVDLKTYYEVLANLSEISPDQMQNNAMPNQKVLCYMNLTDQMLKPEMNLDIAVPKSDETGRALLSRITSDKDELSRQFFSLLLWNKFQPLKGSTAAGGSAALDLVTNQINSLLSQVSKEFKLNLSLDSDELTKENTYEMMFSKAFLDDRVIFTGSFGVENSASQKGGSASNQLIGDVGLEVLLSESGNVRFNVFNESNDNSIIQDKNLGLFTQGAGLYYKEDFDNFDNFKLAQYFLDIFRKKENKKYPIKKKRKQTPVEENDTSHDFINPEMHREKNLATALAARNRI
jgi:hypothetical protein